LKFAIGRYVAKTNVDVPAANNPITTSVGSTTRSWTDSNGNYVPDCNLGNFAAQNNTATGGDVCGLIDNQFFGQNNPKAQQWDPAVLNGWGVRDSNWDISTEVQHQITRGLSASAGYYFNTGGYYRNTATQTKNRVVQNVLTSPSDYDTYCITAPLDARLPGGGGYQVCGLADITPTEFGLNQSVVVPANKFGKPVYRNHFVDFSLEARLRGGARIGGGLDTGKSIVDTCFVVNSPQDLLNCHVVTPFKAQSQVKLNGSVPLPLKFLLAGTLQNLSGPQYQANYPVPTADVFPSLQRNLAGGVKTVTVPLIAPQTLFYPRITRVDMRVSKILMLGHTRLQLNLDAYNALNSSAVTGINSSYNAIWLQPTSVIDPRLLQLSGQVSF
jgi:hypothetical protein